MTETMTRRDREDLAKIARARARHAKELVDQVAAERLAAVEAELSAVYRAEKIGVADITRVAEEAVRAADQLWRSGARS